jgi:predicted nucleic acid-binding protein
VTLVVDAAAVIAALVDDGPNGFWAEELLGAHELAAPHFMFVEAANILRRGTRIGDISRERASAAHGDLLDLRVELFAYAPFAARVWELCGNLTPYDAWYVAVAEALRAPLATLDARLARAPGTRCTFVTP